MSRVSVDFLLSLSRRFYTVAAETARVQPVAAALAKVEPSGSAKQEIFWMKDPKTGYWIPENRFEEVDPAKLRAQLLTKK